MPVYGLQGAGCGSEDDSGERIGTSRPTAAPSRAPQRAGRVGAFPDAEAGVEASDAGATEDGYGEEHHPEPEAATDTMALAFPTGLAMGLQEELLETVLTEAGGTRRVTVKDITSIPHTNYEKVLEPPRWTDIHFPPS